MCSLSLVSYLFELFSEPYRRNGYIRDQLKHTILPQNSYKDDTVVAFIGEGARGRPASAARKLRSAASADRFVLVAQRVAVVETLEQPLDVSNSQGAHAPLCDLIEMLRNS